MDLIPDNFKPEYIDFKKGIRVGHLEVDERITQILKAQLFRIFNEEFLVDHWGRGVFWAYIWFAPRKNLKAKNFKGPGQFPSAKYFIGMESTTRRFCSGLYVESGYSQAEESRYLRGSDWDWNRFIEKLRNDPAYQKELRSLICEEEFELAIGFEENLKIFSKDNYAGSEQVLKEIESRLKEDWVVVQIYYPFSEQEVKAMKGSEVVQAILGSWLEVMNLLNGCLQMQVIKLSVPR